LWWYYGLSVAPTALRSISPLLSKALLGPTLASPQLNEGLVVLIDYSGRGLMSLCNEPASESQYFRQGHPTMPLSRLQWTTE
jgi:hypothetical protein